MAGQGLVDPGALNGDGSRVQGSSVQPGPGRTTATSTAEGESARESLPPSTTPCASVVVQATIKKITGNHPQRSGRRQLKNIIIGNSS